MTEFTRRDHCPACLNRKTHELYSRDYSDPEIWQLLNRDYHGRIHADDFKGAAFKLVECDECLTVYQEQIPSAKILKSIYGDQNFTDSSDPEFNTDKYLEYSREILSVVHILGRPAKSLKVLDYGMGPARWARVARSIGCQSYGLEYVEAFREIARKHGIQVVSDEQLMGLSFDFINAEQVFEHLAEPAQVIECLAAALAPGGILKISVPAAPNIRVRIQKMDWQAAKFSKYSLNPIAPVEHIQCFSGRALTAMAEKVGLKPMKIPLTVQYRYMNNFSGVKNIAKSFLMPLIYNYSNKRLYRFFRK